MQVFTRRW